MVFSFSYAARSTKTSFQYLIQTSLLQVLTFSIFSSNTVFLNTISGSLIPAYERRGHVAEKRGLISNTFILPSWNDSLRLLSSKSAAVCGELLISLFGTNFDCILAAPVIPSFSATLSAGNLTIG